MKKKLAIADIRLDGKTQQRAEIDDVTVQQFANDMRNGDVFPDISVMFDGTDYFLVDGFHRVHATIKLKRTFILADVETGTRREAIWMSLSVNQKHGLRRKYEDVKKMLMETVFPDEEWSKETDAGIADWVKCSESYVNKRRVEYEKSQEAPVEPEPEAEPKDEPETTEEPKPEERQIVIDELGHEVPKHLESVFNRRQEIKDHIKVVSTIFKTIKDAQQKNDLLYVNCKVDQLKADLGNMRRNLRFTLPYAVCCYCQGDVNNQECTLCDQHGFINESTYQAVPAEMKGE